MFGFIKNKDEACVYKKVIVGVLLSSKCYMWMTYYSLEITYQCSSLARLGYPRTSL